MDKIASAVASALPLLRELNGQLTPPPPASKRALDHLVEVLSSQAFASKAPEPLPPAVARMAPVPGVSAGDWTWESLEEVVRTCTKCPHLAVTRTQVVFGVGNRNADLFFVGEAPGADEDSEGEPFVGKAGQLLTKIIQTMGMTRADVFIANVLKCRPDMPAGSSGNRKPRADEMATCLPWLAEQIRLVQPKVIVALGATAVEGLLGDSRPMGAIRGHWLEHEGTPVMPTYHPAYLLRNQSLTEKRKVWEDMLSVMERLALPISDKQRRFFTQ
jgi:DNA polymerase